MEKRIFVIRADKYEIVHAICKYTEKNGIISKSQLRRGLELQRSYARISQAVDWLVSIGVLSTPEPGTKVVKPGKVEKFFTLLVSDWRHMFMPKRENAKLESAKKHIEDLKKHIEDLNMRLSEQEMKIFEQLRDEEIRWENAQADYEQMIGK